MDIIAGEGNVHCVKQNEQRKLNTIPQRTNPLAEEDGESAERGEEGARARGREMKGSTESDAR